MLFGSSKQYRPVQTGDKRSHRRVISGSSVFVSKVRISIFITKLGFNIDPLDAPGHAPLESNTVGDKVIVRKAAKSIVRFADQHRN